MSAKHSEGFLKISSVGSDSVAAREINGSVHVGDIVFSQAGQNPPSAVAAPIGTNNLPSPKSHLFIGRGRELGLLREAAESTRSAVIAQTLHGLGGVGKTSLALQYAHTYLEKYTATWWISAESAESITAGLASLALRLNHLGTMGVTSKESAEWAISWLQSHSGWLLILDNAESPEIAASLIGQVQGGHYLITSRVAAGWGHIASQINIDVLPLKEAVELVTRVSGIDGEEEQKGKIATELGCLPLAVEQAAAYINYTHTSCQRYLELLQSVPGKAFAASADISASSTTIAKTWQVTLKSIEERNPLAIRILRILAWVGSADLPREVTQYFEEDAFDVDAALGLLSAFSMISLTPDSVNVHRLVQAVVRASEEEPIASSSHPYVEAATGIFNTLNLEPETAFDSWPMWRRVLPHIEALDHFVPLGEREDSVALRTLFYFAGRFLKVQDQLEQALNYAEKCVKMAESESAEVAEGPDLLSCMNLLGGTLQAVGRLEESVEIFRNLVRDSVEKCGPVDPFTLSMKNNLASAYQDADLMPEAIDLFEKTLSEREGNLPPDDPGILTSRHNLASAYGISGQPHRSVSLLERVAEDRRRVFGDGSISTLNSMSVLADAYRKSGKLVQAVNVMKRVLGKREEILDKVDPGVLQARQKLADIYRQAGNYKRAVPLYEENLEVALRVYGADDARVIDYGISLAFAHQDAAQPRKAIPLLRRALAWREAMCGESTKAVVTARNNLAIAHWLAGDVKIAAELLRRATSDAENFLESDDEVVRIVRVNLRNLMNGAPVTRACQIQTEIGRSRRGFSTRSV
ncbi:FxSxx-COOH system tetratricopeptide repeat protein [Streptomyces sp. NBC_00893]|uniref:FxSxx-COOH system tetratricopeptide repeat protein n=1 Tax=Streptomyces sp. NBC_00893 TaxID=2975862 RepID=UPI0022536C82|nr:FxSxx-COOH system tetratricopeptide repeat protein [Streptomyces sp. NBC_00893]MCX4847376.1 FxSxx-COOH system tetratricopeptide repeat protein [Streptomyces sp. NBC_00893]